MPETNPEQTALDCGHEDPHVDIMSPAFFSILNNNENALTAAGQFTHSL